MLTREQIIEKADLVEKAAGQMIGHLEGVKRAAGNLIKIQETLMNCRRKADLIATTMKELRLDREARHAAIAQPKDPDPEATIENSPAAAS